jgi:competence protein ComEC
MKNIFTPLFLSALSILALLHHLEVANYEVFPPLVLIVMALAAGAFMLKNFRLSYVLIVAALGLLIGGQFVKEKQAFYRTVENSHNIPSGRYITVKGSLKTFPEIKQDHSVILLETEYLEFARKQMSISCNIRIKVKGDLRHLYRGDSIIIDARVYLPMVNSNFFTNPVEHFRLVNQMHFYGYCKSAQMVEVVEKTGLFWRIVGSWRNRIRAAVEGKYGQADAQSNENVTLDKKGVLLQAILIGERGKLSADQKEQLLSAGVFHLLAISGAHIGIIALGCLLLFRLLRVSVKKRYIVTALVLVLFLVLSGFKVSAERAVLMAVLIFIARIFYLETDIYNIISFSGLLILMRNPAAFLDAGFILTFTLTAAIVMGRKVLLPLFPFYGKQEKILSAEQDHGKAKKLPSYIAELISANLSAAIIALPLSLYFFKRYSFGGFFSGLLLVPLTAMIIGSAFLLIPLALLSPFISQALLTVADVPLRIFFYITGFFSSALDMSIYRASPPLLSVLLILVLFALLSVSKKTIQKVALTTLVLLLTVLLSLNIFFYAPESLEVYFLDVGQGDCQVVVFPGGDGLLIDGGGVYYTDFQVGKNIVLPFILQKRINIRWVAVSHHHADHVRGIIEIIRILEPEELWLSSAALDDVLYRDLLRATPTSTRIIKIAAPQKRTTGDCTVQWLYPQEFIETNRARNSHSQVIKISDRFHSFLFTGDIEKEEERELAKTSCSRVRADVIKVPHHGSSTSSSREFLRCVSPRLAVFSYAPNNRFRFPHKSVIANYRRQKTQSLATARRGGIRLVSLPERIHIETSK